VMHHEIITCSRSCKLATHTDAGSLRMIVTYPPAQCDLRAHANKQAGELSGGTRRKLAVALALIGDPHGPCCNASVKIGRGGRGARRPTLPPRLRLPIVHSPLRPTHLSYHSAPSLLASSGVSFGALYVNPVPDSPLK